MIVDDDNDVATSLKILLEHQNYEEKEEEQEQDTTYRSTHKTRRADKEFEVVDVFNDPELALSNFKLGRYDLLLLDIVMPKLDGFQLYEQMKNIDDNVKVCFITAYMINYDAIRNLFPNTAQIDCFIRKPIEQNELKEGIRKELKRSL